MTVEHAPYTCEKHPDEAMEAYYKALTAQLEAADDPTSHAEETL